MVSSHSGDAAAAGVRGPRRLTFNNMDTFNAREKKLPPDANAQAATNAKLLQLPERASFYCSKCRRDNIISDSLAVDSTHQVMLCVRCFTRVIRPRTYRPSRVVPFPSLLSWLNYKPSRVMDMSEDVASRPAEAVAPSGERMATPTLSGGDRPTHIQNLPAIAMNTVATPRHAAALQQQQQKRTQQMAQEELPHPCCRVWGNCVHGETCLFRNAPQDLCLGFLMGLCSGEEKSCALLHQRVFELPNTAADPMPPNRRAADVEDANSVWAKWIARRRNSANRAEWQLWHNGPVTALLDVYAPLSVNEEAQQQEQEQQKQQQQAPAAVKLNFADISAALRGLK